MGETIAGSPRGDATSGRVEALARGTDGKLHTGGREPRSVRHRLLVAGGAVLVALLLAEVALRVGYRVASGTWDFLPTVRVAAELYRPHPYLCYSLVPGAQVSAYGGVIHINRWGFRGPDMERVKGAGVIRIACLGGSTTFGIHATDDAYTWPAQLERLLNERHAPTRFEVLNLGVPGYTSVESLLTFALRALDFAPDIVLMQDALNDVPAVFGSGFVPDYGHFRAPYSPLFGTGLARTALGRLCLAAVPHLSGIGATGPGQLSKRAVHVFVRHQESLVALAQARGIQPVFVTMPDSLPSDPKDWRERNDTIRLARLLIHAQRQRAAILNVPVIDLAQTFPKDMRYFTDDVHKTDAGEEVAARMTADALEAAGILSGVSSRGVPATQPDPTNE